MDEKVLFQNEGVFVLKIKLSKVHWFEIIDLALASLFRQLLLLMFNIDTDQEGGIHSDYGSGWNPGWNAENRFLVHIKTIHRQSISICSYLTDTTKNLAKNISIVLIYKRAFSRWSKWNKK